MNKKYFGKINFVIKGKEKDGLQAVSIYPSIYYTQKDNLIVGARKEITFMIN